MMLTVLVLCLDDDDFYYERKGCVINCSTARYMTILLVDLHHII